MIELEFTQKFKKRVIEGNQMKETRLTYPTIPFSLEYIEDIKHALNI